MTYEVHKNENGDLLCTFSFPGEESEDLCVGIDKRWMDAKDKECFIPDWQDRIAQELSTHTGRPLTSIETTDLAASIKSAKVTDGIDLVAMAAKRPAPEPEPAPAPEPDPAIPPE